MIEIECPFCEEPCRVEATAFAPGAPFVRCESCRVEVELAEDSAAALPLAA